MRYLTMLKTAENLSEQIGPPPAALFQAIGAFAEDVAKDGVLLEQGGLMPSFAGALIQVDNGTLQVLDGPFTEAKELVGGYAFIEYRTKEGAIEFSRRFMQVHIDNWPGFVGSCEIRQVADFAPDFASDAAPASAPASAPDSAQDSAPEQP